MSQHKTKRQIPQWAMQTGSAWEDLHTSQVRRSPAKILASAKGQVRERDNVELL